MLAIVATMHLCAYPSRRAMLGSSAALAMPGLSRRADAAVALPPGFEGDPLRGTLSSPRGSSPPARVEGIGGGFDILANNELAVADVTFPPFLNGTWDCTRQVSSVEGDVGQAQGAWRLLGGTGELTAAERYAVRFVDGRRVDGAAAREPIIGMDGRKYFGVVQDRAFELDSRVNGANVSWDAAAPNTLSYQRAGGGLGSAAELAVVQRGVELPSETSKGWGSNELVRVTTTAGGVFGDIKISYAARVRRRFRRGLTDDGDRLVEGLEIMTTYRVLDGVAGIEMPTSTTKSTIRLTRRE